MVYYVRFLKTPKAQVQKGRQVLVSALITITTDLGDDFLADDASLEVRLLDATKHSVLHKISCQWQAGKRELPLTLGPFRLISTCASLRLSVESSTVEYTYCDRLDNPESIPVVISGRSAAFDASSTNPADKLIERRFQLCRGIQLPIWEETGNAFARHIWLVPSGHCNEWTVDADNVRDAALATVICLQRAIFGASEQKSAMSHLSEVLLHPARQTLRVIELGCGCGIVGIALAQMLPQCAVTLTDLTEAAEIAMRNIEQAHLARGSTVNFDVLDWDQDPLPNQFDRPTDIILVSDCTYNVDSLPSLVRVLDVLTGRSPGALILVAAKRRHDSEAIFFDLMRNANLVVLKENRFHLPMAYYAKESIEIYAFRRASMEAYA